MIVLFPELPAYDRCCVARLKNRLVKVCRPAPEGVHRGGRLEAGAMCETDKGSFDRLRGQRLPYAIFFDYFLAWLQESDSGRFVKF